MLDLSQLIVKSTFPPQYKDDILYAIEKHQVLIVEAETGSGKSTQICQYLVDAGYTNAADHHYMVGITQPRRVAATTLANRVAEEMNCPLGTRVGYSIRFEERLERESTEIKFMTEGILIREMFSDPLLNDYSVLMVDETHERTIAGDILLGLLRKILRKRPQLKLVISSATLESDVLIKFFTYENVTCHRLHLQGKQHPLDILYLKQPVADYLRASVDAVIKIHECERRGDILVFLTGQNEVDKVVDILKDYSRSLNDRPEVDLSGPKKLYALPLYASLPAYEQMKVFDQFPRSVRKVVVATNLAETSLTIDGVVYVVDCGFVKTRIFDSKTGTDALMVIPVSKASARQRAGRAGRTAAGKVYRLYTKTDHDQTLLDHSVPEIQRSDLSGMLLQLKALGIDNVLNFRFPSDPPEANVIIALELLYALGCIDAAGHLTPEVGLKAAELPLTPMFAKMLLASHQYECSEEILTICAMLQIENIFQQPSQGQRAIQARNAKHKFSVEEGDLITYLNVFNAFIAAGKVRSWSDRHYLNYNGLLRAVEIRLRLSHLLRRLSIPLRSADGDLDRVRKCIVAGFFANAALWHHSGCYRSVRGQHELHVHPTSVLSVLSRPPRVVLFAQLLHTSKQFIRDLTSINSEWLHEIAPHFYEYGTERELNERKFAAS